MPFQRQAYIILIQLLLSFALTAQQSASFGGTDSLSVSAGLRFKTPDPDTVVNYGKLFLNTPYRYGASGSAAFDCSGFTSFVYRNFGYKLGHSSSEQAAQFDAVKKAELRPGDLVYFAGHRKSKRIGHVGMVVQAKENGSFDFIHASNGRGVIISSSEEPYYSSRYIKANRVLGGTQLVASLSSRVPDEPETSENLIQVPAATQVTKTKKSIPAQYHTVRRGETLSSIAEKYGITVAELKKDNRLKSNKINLKQRLKVKDAETYTVMEPATQLAQTEKQETLVTSEQKEQPVTSSKDIRHKVKRGESLFSISHKYNVSVDELKQMNNIPSGKIVPGQELIVTRTKEITPTESTVNRVATTSNVTKTITHKVIPGESLFSIAKQYNVSVNELKKANNLNGTNIHAGQTLQINLSFNNTVDLASAHKAPETIIPINTESPSKPELEKTQSKNTRISSKEKTRTEIIAEEKEEYSKHREIPGWPAGTKIINHKVHAGESLITLSRDFKVSPDEIKQANNLTDNKLSPGQEVIILIAPIAPGTTTTTSGTTESPEEELALTTTESTRKQIAPTNVSGEEKTISRGAKTTNTNADETKTETKPSVATTTYKIRKGDNLNAIATKFGTTVDELKRINRIQGNKLNFGQVIKVQAPKNEIEKAPATFAAEELTSYKVKRGDNLNAIATKFGTTIDELKRINHIQGSKLNFGQVIKVQAPKNKVDKETATRVVKETSTYKVRKGDNLGAIAAKFNTTPEKLREINRLSGDQVKYGQTLRITDEENSLATEKKQDKETPATLKTHKVRKGENLTSIAKDYNVTVEELRELNGMTDAKISYGQELKVPEAARKAEKEPEQSSTSSSKGKPIRHKVKSGESLYSIAKKFGCSFNDLKEWNPKSTEKLAVGDEVIIYK